MSKWDFSKNSKKEVRSILFLCRSIGNLGVELDEEMLKELNDIEGKRIKDLEEKKGNRRAELRVEKRAERIKKKALL